MNQLISSLAQLVLLYMALPQLTTNQFGFIGTFVVLLTQTAVYLQSRVNTKKLDVLNINLNGRLAELITAVKAQSKAEGLAEGRAEGVSKEKARSVAHSEGVAQEVARAEGLEQGRGEKK
jgi:hypothetical protein